MSGILLYFLSVIGLLILLYPNTIFNILIGLLTIILGFILMLVVISIFWIIVWKLIISKLPIVKEMCQ